MSDQDEDLLFSHDQDQPAFAWWSPSSLLTPEATSITAFTIALSSMVGIGGSMLVAQSVVGTPIGPSGLRAQNLIAAAITLAMALGAILLASSVLRQAEPRYAQWARHLAGAAVAVAATGTVLSAAALIGAVLSHTPADGQVFVSGLSNSAATYGTGG
jgi:hypothetical protein